MTATSAFHGFHRRRDVNGCRPAATKVCQLPANRGDPARTTLFEPHGRFTCRDDRPPADASKDKIV
jgi:hypothetical protein